MYWVSLTAQTVRCGTNGRVWVPRAELARLRGMLRNENAQKDKSILDRMVWSK